MLRMLNVFRYQNIAVEEKREREREQSVCERVSLCVREREKIRTEHNATVHFLRRQTIFFHLI